MGSREETVLKIWKHVIASSTVVGELSPRQKIMHIKFVKPELGLAGNSTSSRDVVVIANRYYQPIKDRSGKESSDEGSIVMGSINTSMVPEKNEHHKDHHASVVFGKVGYADSATYVRGEAKVLGFLVKSEAPGTCSITLVTDFLMRGAFDSGCMKCLMNCSGIDKKAAQKVAIDNSKALKRLMTALETLTADRSKNKRV